jgi:hypothetical protein
MPNPIGFSIQGSSDNQFEERQVHDNYNQDKLHRFRGTLARMRRKAMLSKNPAELAAYLQLASTLNVDPSFSSTGRESDRRSRAVNKLEQDKNAARLFSLSSMGWLKP